MIDKLLEDLGDATCNFCAVKLVEERLRKHGFNELNLQDSWPIKADEKYYVKKNGSAIVAFKTGTKSPEESGFRIIASHSDSPCFKLKPNPEIINSNGVVALNVEKYGGSILSTWFDRPLSISGRVFLKSQNPFTPVEHIIDLKKPVATIPNLAIHFERNVNDGKKISVQKDMRPIIGFYSKHEIEETMRQGGFIKKLIAEHLGVSSDKIISSELSLYPVFTPVKVGLNSEFIQAGRIDDLSMVFTSTYAFLNVSENSQELEHTTVLAIFDNEETGSMTKQGAHSPLLKTVLSRICNSLASNGESLSRAVAKSFLISADDAHAFHPNYAEKHDIINKPVIGGGPVIKINANCKYMTDAYSSAVFSSLCEKAGVEYQYFVNHGDVVGGSTLGNILTTQLEIAGVDMGCAIWAMHSSCETAGVKDHIDTEKVFSCFFGESMKFN